MITKVVEACEVWKCDRCGWKWFPRGEEVPMRCPNLACRKRASKEGGKPWVRVDTEDQAHAIVAAMNREVAECKRCGGVIYRDVKNPKYWYCGTKTCRRQFDDEEVKFEKM